MPYSNKTKTITFTRGKKCSRSLFTETPPIPPKFCAIFVVCLTIFFVAGHNSVEAYQEPTLIFQDDFERNESDESKEELGNGWSTNSKSRAKGNKQADLREDGSLHIYRHKEADHGVSIRHDAEFTDGLIETRFKLENDKDSLGVNIADLKDKSVHAGHLFRVTVGLKKLEIADLKTGVMRLDIRTARKSKEELSEEQKKALVGKTKRVPIKLEKNKWYKFSMRVAGDTCEVSIDGDKKLSLKSPGIAHPTKRMLRLAIAKQVVVDDLKIYRIGSE